MKDRGSNQDYVSQIRHLVPLDSINDRSFDRLIARFTIKTLPKKTKVFELGDIDDQSIYLLEGELLLTSQDGKEKTLVGGQGSSLYALSNLKPRQYTATSRTPVVLANISTEELEQVLNWDQMAALPDESAYEVEEIDEDSDISWMFDMMRTKHFENIPSSNVYRLFSRFEHLDMKNGDVVLQQNEPGDYYYIVRTGSCQVSRRRSGPSEGEDVYLLQAGDAFGEEALISDQPRNATVTMSSDGVLMRLNRDDFRELLQAPLLNWIDKREATEKVKHGAQILDIRLETEFRHGSIKSARNFPLYDLRTSIDQLDKEKDYIVVCNTGSRSASAAYLLGERGYSASVLEGGLASLMDLSG
jgi:CRP-like cAMP-binding protein